MLLITEGVDLPFARTPSGRKLFNWRNHPSTADNRRGMSLTLEEMLLEGCLAPFDTKGGKELPKAMFSSRAVGKANTDRIRITSNLRPINKFIPDWAGEVDLPTMHKIRNDFPLNSWLFGYDL